MDSVDQDFLPWYVRLCTCELEGLPPCWRLIDDPVGTVLDRTRWPVRVCFDVAQTLTDNWAAREFLKFTEMPSAALRVMYPLPVGTQALMRASRQREIIGLGAGDALRLGQFLPFDDEAFAAVALAAAFPRSKVTFFGTAQRVAQPLDPLAFPTGPRPDADGLRAGTDVYLLADSLFVVRGPRPDDPQARQFVAACRAWWRTLEGQALYDLSRAGRPPGSAHVGSVAEFADRIFPIIRDLVTAGERPTQAAVCERITATWPEYRDGRTTCTARQLRRWFERYWADWETVVQAAMSSETD